MATASASTTENPYGVCVTCGEPATGNVGTDSYCDACGATHNAKRRQPIAIITNVAAPEVDTDVVGQIIKLLDEALALYERSKGLAGILTGYYQSRCDRLLALFEEHHPDAEYAYRLWASAHAFLIDEWMHDVPEYRQRCRIIGIVVGKTDNGTAILLATLHGVNRWQAAPQPVDEPLAPVTAGAVRDALRAPHWTDEKSSALDEQDREVVTTEVSR